MPAADAVAVPCSLVQRSPKEAEANVWLGWAGGRLQLRARRPIAAGAELLYWPEEARGAAAEERRPDGGEGIAAPREAGPRGRPAVRGDGASPGGTAAEPRAGRCRAGVKRGLPGPPVAWALCRGDGAAPRYLCWLVSAPQPRRGCHLGLAMLLRATSRERNMPPSFMPGVVSLRNTACATLEMRHRGGGERTEASPASPSLKEKTVIEVTVFVPEPQNYCIAESLSLRFMIL